MTWYKITVYGLECEVENCAGAAEFAPPPDEHHKLAATMRSLAQPPDNWRHVRGKDICGRTDAAHDAARRADR